VKSSRAAGLVVLALFASSVGARSEIPGPPRCDIDERAAPSQPSFVSATVRGPATAAEVRAQTAAAIFSTRAPLSPAYAALPRVFAFFVVGGVRHGTIAAVIDGHVPVAGEVVKLASRHRDPDMPCHFIPWIVVPGEMV
jgi:hypothetical protein